ncbi:MAG: helix-turn-helix transcriptional regulator [Clostridia bacterium]|nr:helix-turn-helix transcriptional regulator [Clostridia bacterium]
MSETFGEFFKQRRQEKNLTQKELAKLLIVSESAVSKWEKNVARPDIALLPKLAEILGVSEHELITASIDNQARQEKIQAKKWRTVSFTWSLFFYIAYTIALIPCFICNLAIDKTLSWFWIVVSALLLAFTFTNLPKLITKNRLLFLPLASFTALCILLATCAVYTKGDWFWIAIVSVFFGVSLIFTPIYLCKYGIFARMKKYADFISILVAFVLLNVLLLVADFYSVGNDYVQNHWYWKFGLPISLVVYLIINLLVAVRFLKINRFLKTGAVLFLADCFCYLVPPLIRTKNPTLQRTLNDCNIFKADFSTWKPEITLDNNIHCIIFLSVLALSALFLTIGLIRHFIKKTK